MNDDRFEDDLRAVVRETAPGQAPVALRERLSTVTDQPATHSTWFASMVRWATYLVIVAAVAGVAFLALEQRQFGPTPSPTDTPAGDSVRLDLGGVVLDYPADWVFHESRFVSSFYTVLGYLTTGGFDPGAPCTQDRRDQGGCNLSLHPLEPGGVLVRFELWGPPGIGIGARSAETIATVRGMPAYFSETESADTVTLTWRTRTPGSPNSWYEIEANMRGPGTDELRHEVEAMIASLRFDPPPTLLPTSGPDFDLQAAEAARRALDSLRSTPFGNSYSCFDPQPDVVRTTEVEIVPQNIRLSEPLEVTCSTFVEADVDLWRVRFVMAWAATDDHGAGRQEIEVWVTADGEPGLTHLSGNPPQ